MDRSKVPGIFVILLGGALLNLALAHFFSKLSADWFTRIIGFGAVVLACLYWADILPKRKA